MIQMVRNPVDPENWSLKRGNPLRFRSLMEIDDSEERADGFFREFLMPDQFRMESPAEKFSGDRGRNDGVVSVDVLGVEGHDHADVPSAGDSPHIVSEFPGGFQHVFPCSAADSRIGFDDA